MELKQIPINKIKPDREQPRTIFKKEILQELASTYKEQEIIQPIEIDEKKTIISGERRWRAAKISGLKKIPCIIKKSYAKKDKDTRIKRWKRQLVADSHVELSIPEKAKIYKKIKKLLGNSESAADELGIPITTFKQTLSYNNAPQNWKDAVEEKKLSATDVIDIQQKVPEENQQEVFEESVEIKEEGTPPREFIRSYAKEEHEEPEFDEYEDTENKINELSEILIDLNNKLFKIDRSDFKEIKKAIQSVFIREAKKLIKEVKRICEV